MARNCSAHDNVRTPESPARRCTIRLPNTRGLGLQTLGIELDEAGAVPVNAQLHTTAAGVYAIGDVTHKKNLTPVAIAEGRALADSLFGPEPTRSRSEPGGQRRVHLAADRQHRPERKRSAGSTS